jgi:hypothetical protein
MKKYLLLFLVSACALPSFGQGRDTVFAVHKLFREKRGGAKTLQSFSDSSAMKAYRAERAGRPLTAQEVRQDRLANTGFTIAAMVKESKYSLEEEAYVIRRYNDGGPIPPDIRRKLRRKHFHVTARDVVGR